MPKIVPTVVALILVLATASLGYWQLNRANQKEQLQKSWLEAAKFPVIQNAAVSHGEVCDVEGRRVQLEGQFVHDWSVYLDNRPYQRQAGFYVLTPFRLKLDHGLVPEDKGAVYIWVNRGWIPRHSQQRTRIALFAKPLGLIRIHGSCIRHIPAVFEFVHTQERTHQDTEYDIRQNLDITAFAAEKQQPFLSAMIQQGGSENVADNEGLVQDWANPDFGIERHYGYAFQWFALMSLTLILYFYFTCVKRAPLRGPD